MRMRCCVYPVDRTDCRSRTEFKFHRIRAVCEIKLLPRWFEQPPYMDEMSRVLCRLYLNFLKFLKSLPHTRSVICKISRSGSKVYTHSFYHKIFHSNIKFFQNNIKFFTFNNFLENSSKFPPKRLKIKSDAKWFLYFFFSIFLRFSRIFQDVTDIQKNFNFSKCFSLFTKLFLIWIFLLNFSEICIKMFLSNFLKFHHNVGNVNLQLF